MRRVIAMATGDADSRAGCGNTRTGNIAGIDCIAQSDVRITFRAHIAHRGETGLKGHARIPGPIQRLPGHRYADARITDLVGIGGQMGMHVHQARQQGGAAEVDDFRASGNGEAGADIGDTFACDEHHRTFDHIAVAHVDHARRLYRDHGFGLGHRRNGWRLRLSARCETTACQQQHDRTNSHFRVQGNFKYPPRSESSLFFHVAMKSADVIVIVRENTIGNANRTNI